MEDLQGIFHSALWVLDEATQYPKTYIFADRCTKTLFFLSTTTNVH